MAALLVRGAMHLHTQTGGRPAGDECHPDAAVRRLLPCCSSSSSAGSAQASWAPWHENAHNIAPAVKPAAC